MWIKIWARAPTATTADPSHGHGRVTLNCSNQARRCEGYRESDRGPRKPTQTTLEGREQCVFVELSERPLVEAEYAVDARDVAPDESGHRAQGALCIRERQGANCRDDCGNI